MADSEHVQRFVVEVPTFGDPERIGEELLLRLARAVHNGVKAGAVIQRVEEVANTLSRRGEPVRYDAKGDDMGNHLPEHTAPLIPLGPQPGTPTATL